MRVIVSAGLKSPNLKIEGDEIDNKILMKNGIEINELMNNLKQIESRIREMDNNKCAECIIL